MSEYHPGAENRGTCPACDRRVTVGPPDGNGRRRCHRHRMTGRARVFLSTNDLYCAGGGEVCLEDRPARGGGRGK